MTTNITVKNLTYGYLVNIKHTDMVLEESYSVDTIEELNTLLETIIINKHSK